MTPSTRSMIPPALRSRTVPPVVLEQLQDGRVDLGAVLDLVEKRLAEQVTSSYTFVDRAARYLIDAGGKRFRPMLVGLTGHLGNPDPAITADAGVVVELVHLATLYHDDVIDEATARRGATSANIRWDNTIAVATGDYLFARASELSADLGVEVTRIMAQTIATLCEGEIREVQGSRGALPPDVPRLDAGLEHYLAVVSEKTASLIATSCRLGPLLAGCAPAEIEASARYGWNVGMAFQLSDDILDIASNAETSGKTPGTDLREGVRTLPVLYALESEPDGELAALLDRDVLDDTDVDRALALLRGNRALDRARDTANGYAQAAVDELEVFEDGAVVKALRRLAEYAVARVG